MKVGDKVYVLLGKHRATSYKNGYIPIDCVADHTLVTISHVPTTENGWISIKECTGKYVYPREFLKSSKYILLKALGEYNARK